MAEDWRVHARLGEQDHAVALTERLEAMELERESLERLGGRIVVSRDGQDVFLYADTEPAAREAEGVVRSLLEERGHPGEVDLRRWHPDAEDWEPAEEPLPQTDEERDAERAELMAREAAETREQGYSEWEVRIHLPSRHEAAELQDRLEAEGLPCTRRWRYLLVGAESEDAANALAERLRGDVPPDSEVTVEGTFRAAGRGVPNPFAFLGGLGN